MYILFCVSLVPHSAKTAVTLEGVSSTLDNKSSPLSPTLHPMIWFSVSLFSSPSKFVKKLKLQLETSWNHSSVFNYTFAASLWYNAISSTLAQQTTAPANTSSFLGGIAQNKARHGIRFLPEAMPQPPSLECTVPTDTETASSTVSKGAEVVGLIGGWIIIRFAELYPLAAMRRVHTRFHHHGP